MDRNFARNIYMHIVVTLLCNTLNLKTQVVDR
jgi:hypothetical protein